MGMGMGMAAGESATAFLETSLGTRLAVSFPARATTVADLKRRVSAEHAASFPHIGQITVNSFKVRRRGSLYHLTDSMAVQAAFHGFKGAWYLQADAVPHSAVARKDAKCGTDMEMHHALCAQQNATHFIADCTCNTSPLAQDSLADPSLQQQQQQQDRRQQHVVHTSHGLSQQLGVHASTRTSLPPDVIVTPLHKCKTLGSHAENGQCVGENVMLGKNSYLDVASAKDDGPVRDQRMHDVINKPRGKKHSREEDENHGSIYVNCDDSLTSVVSSKQNDGKKCKQADVNSLCRGDVATPTHSYENETSRGQAALENSQNQDEGVNSLGKIEELKSTRSADDVHSLLASHKHEANSITSETESNAKNPALCCLVNENDSTAVAEKHANEESQQEKLVEQHGHLNNDAEGKNSLLKDESAFPGKTGISGVLQNCTSRGPSFIYSESLSDHQYEGPSRSLDLKRCKKSKGELLTDHVSDHSYICSEVKVTCCNIERASGEKHDNSIKKCGSVSAEQCIDSATVGASAYPFTPNVELSEKKSNRTEQTDQDSDPLQHDLADHANSWGGKPSCGRKDPWTAEVCNDSDKGTDLPPCVECTKGGDYSEKEVMACKGEKQKKSKTTCTHEEGTLERTQSGGSLLSDQQKSSISEAKNGQRDLERHCQNAEKDSDGTTESARTGVPLDDVTKEKNAPLRDGSFSIPDTTKAPTSNDHCLNKGKDEGATSTDSMEQETCCQRRRQRVTVRKVPISRLTKMYGFR